MKYKEKTRLLIANIVSGISYAFVKMHLIRPKVIVHVDGGICSQMRQWLIGQYYADGGFDVFYNLEWYVRWGKGLDGKIEMPFELQEMCPNIKVRQLSTFKNRFYRYCLRITDFDNTLPKHETVKHSIYISRYPAIPNEEWRSENFLRFYGIDKITTVPDYKLPRVEGKLLCAVHVRRGDLASLTIPGHYYVTPNWYFYDAIRYVIKKYKNVRFCFFSDELDFVESDIIPHLSFPDSCDYVMMRGNKSYEDLVLLARCNIIIGSQGNASRHGAMMNPQAALILPKIENEKVVGYDIVRE